MGIESGQLNEQKAGWQAPETGEPKSESEFKAMSGLARFLQKMPGGKYLLPAAAMATMLGGVKEASANPAQEYLRVKEGMKMPVSIALACEFQAGITRQVDGNYVVEKMPPDSTLLGDFVYNRSDRSGQEIILPQDPEKAIQADLSQFKKELEQVCRDQQLTLDLGGEVEKFAHETFPNGFSKDGFITVEQYNDGGQVEKKEVKAQWATFGQARAAIVEHMIPVQEKVSHSIKDNSSTKVTQLTLRELCQLVDEAATFNLARAQAEESGQ